MKETGETFRIVTCVIKIIDVVERLFSKMNAAIIFQFRDIYIRLVSKSVLFRTTEPM